MNNKKETSYEDQVFQKTYKRIHLSPSQRIVYQRILIILIANNKPFLYPTEKLSEITGFDKRTIYRCMKRLEECRLIKRTGIGKNRRIQRGSILSKILSTVTNKNKYGIKTKKIVR